MYLSKNNSVISILTLMFLFMFTACSDNGTGVDPDSPDNGTDGPAATINGSVDESSQSKVQSGETTAEAGVVSAARINSSGSVEIIEGTETEVDASGRFSLQVDAEVSDHIVIVAETAEGQVMGFISAEIENNQSYTIKPITAESSAETAVFAEIVANGKANIVQKSDIEVAVNTSAAADINASSSAAAEVAAAISNSAEARAEFIAEFESDASFNQAAELIADAQFQLESNLDAAASDDERKAAFDAFLEAKVNAYAESGMEMSNIGKMFHLQAEVKQNTFSSASADIENSARASVSVLAAIAIDNAVNAKVQASGASDATVSAIADAGVNLRAELESSSGAAAEIETAFETYHQEVRAAFESDSSTEAAVIVTVDAEINVNGGVKSTFESSLSGLLDLGTLTEVYADFTSSVQSSVETQSEVIGEVDVKTVTDIVVLINLFS